MLKFHLEFGRSHALEQVTYGCESWTIKKAECQRIEFSILQSLLDSKEIKPVNLKGNQLYIFIGRADAEAETPNTSAT